MSTVKSRHSISATPLPTSGEACYFDGIRIIDSENVDRAIFHSGDSVIGDMKNFEIYNRDRVQMHASHSTTKPQINYR